MATLGTKGGAIATLRLRLLPLGLADAHRMLHGEDTGLPCAEGYPLEASLLAAGFVVAAERERRELGPYGWYQIVADGRVVGDCGFLGPPDEDGTVSVSFGLAPAMTGRGYGTEAICGLLAFAAGQPEVKRVLADTAPSNHARRRVYEDAGMRAVGDDGEMLIYST